MNVCIVILLFQVEKILDDWRDYKLSVPTYGAIILNEDLSQVNPCLCLIRNIDFSALLLDYL